MQLDVRVNNQVARRCNAPPEAVCNSTLCVGNSAQAALEGPRRNCRSRHQAGQATHLRPAWLSCGWCGAAAGQKPGESQ